MSKHTPVEPERHYEPTITYNRTLNLDALDGGVKLSHMQELLRQAHDRGFSPDAAVSIRGAYSFMSNAQSISISDKR